MNWIKALGMMLSAVTGLCFSAGSMACAITISSPTAGAIFNPPATVNVALNHNCPDFTIYLYDNGVQIGTINGGGDPPNITKYYNYTWTGVGSGSHRLTAYIGGAVNVTSPAINFTVRQLRDATYISQSVPTTMVAGQTYSANVKMRNDGGATWALADGYKLGSQNPGDNTTWGTSRVGVVGSVATGQTASFDFTISAPTTGGTYNFQWRMVDEGVAWFGATAPNMAITVLSGSIAGSPSTCTIPSGGSTCSTTVTWNSNASGAQVWVSGLDGSNPQLFASGQNGSQVATWITSAGSRFQLKVGSDTLATVDVRGNPAPSVNLTAPVAGATYTAPASIALMATASDDTGVNKVEFYNGSTKLGEATTPPYAFTWINVAGSSAAYQLSVRAIDTQGAVTDSATRSVIVNTLPTISLMSPSNGATADPPATLQLQATAADADDSVSAVEFYADGALVNRDTSAPYAYSWTSVASGVHSIYATALDSRGGSATTPVINATVSKVIGYIDGLVLDEASGYLVRGWACSTGLNQSINVHLYLGGAAGTGSYIGSYTANRTSEAAVAAACSAQGTAYRFELPITLALRQKYPDASIYVHGISPIGRANNLLTNSGAFQVPADVSVVGTIEYDELGRVIAERGSNGQSRTYTYDGNDNLLTIKRKTSATEFATTTMTYDALNRVSTSKDALNGTTYFSYDSADRLTQVKDPRGLITTYTYDGFGQRWRQISPDTGTTNFEYGTDGLLTKMTRADGSWLRYEYDGMGRPSWVGNDAEWRQVKYTTCSHGDGNGKGILPCGVTASNGTWTQFTYTNEGLLSMRRDSANGSNDVTGYSYDGMGRLTGIGYPSGISVGYSYVEGKLAAITATVGGTVFNVATGIKYAPQGAITEWLYGNGLTRHYNYDLDGRVTGISAGDSNSVSQSLTYQLNTANEVAKLTNGIDASRTQSYGYDGLSRLINIVALNDTVNMTDGFDAGTNRATRIRNDSVNGNTALTYAIDVASNRIIGVSGSETRAFTYTATGNRLAETGSYNRSFIYDAFDRMRSATSGGVTTTYTINALDQRVDKSIAAGAETRYFYAGQNQLLAENSPTGWKSYIWLGNELIGLVEPNSTLDFVHTDRLGRPEVVTNQAKATVWRAANDPYNRGILLDQIGGLNIGFPGQYWDAESGLWHNGLRDYDPALGRYVEPDPIGLAGGLNAYGYVVGNPVNYVDPYGLAAAGHHVFPQSIWRGLNNLSRDVRQLFDRAVVRPAARHGFSRPHAAYNRIARKAWDEFCKNAGKDLKDMTKETAQDFLDYLNSNPEISRFNEQIQSGEELTVPDENVPLTEFESPIAPGEPVPMEILEPMIL